MSALTPFLATIADCGALSEDEAASAFEIIMSGTAGAAEIGAFLMGLRVRGETVEEITGAARIMRQKALAVTAPAGAIDIVGTGGDAKGTYNISTGAAIVAAACGAVVAKHGNRAVSSKSGAADVLKALGVNLDADMSVIETSLREAGVGFLFAPRHHSAMKHVVPVRAELGVRTVFNLLGPLSNPAGTTRQLTGVFADHWVEPLARVLGKLGLARAWVVHGSDGLDEITTTGPTKVAEWVDGDVRLFEISPEDAGIARAQIDDLKGGDAEENARALTAAFTTGTGPLADALALNAGAGLVIAGRATDLPSGVSQARKAMQSGAATRTLERLVAITRGADSAA